MEEISLKSAGTVRRCMNFPIPVLFSSVQKKIGGFTEGRELQVTAGLTRDMEITELATRAHRKNRAQNRFRFAHGAETQEATSVGALALEHSPIHIKKVLSLLKRGGGLEL